MKGKGGENMHNFNFRIQLKHKGGKALDFVESHDFFDNFLSEKSDELPREVCLTQEDYVDLERYLTLHVEVEELDSEKLSNLISEFLKKTEKDILLTSVFYGEDLKDEYAIFENQPCILGSNYEEKYGQIKFYEQTQTDIFEDRNIPRKYMFECFFEKPILLKDLDLKEFLQHFSNVNEYKKDLNKSLEMETKGANSKMKIKNG